MCLLPKTFLSYTALIRNTKFKNWIFNHQNLITTSVVEVEEKWTFPFIVGKNLISIYTNLKTIPIGATVFKTSLRIFYKNEDKTTEGYKYNNIYYTTDIRKITGKYLTKSRTPYNIYRNTTNRKNPWLQIAWFFFFLRA